MTFLEKAKELSPELTENEILENKCPCHLKFERFHLCWAQTRIDCWNCWNREMPEVIIT